MIQSYMQYLWHHFVLPAGFGQRFAKPKGPRTYPDTWVWGHFLYASKSGAFHLMMVITVHCIAKRTWRDAGLLQAFPAEDHIRGSWEAIKAAAFVAGPTDNQRSVSAVAPPREDKQEVPFFTCSGVFTPFTRWILITERRLVEHQPLRA